MPIESFAEKAPETRAFAARVRTCFSSNRVYDGLTNQVPATWFAGDAGIRRLASQSDGPVNGAVAAFSANVFGCLDDQLERSSQ